MWTNFNIYVCDFEFICVQICILMWTKWTKLSKTFEFICVHGLCGQIKATLKKQHKTNVLMIAGVYVLILISLRFNPV